ncbi:TPA: hypothetical protein N2D60_003535 [Clostridium botulinum]|nr:hypothetical protein [Clostridium botulinum]
MNINEKVKEMSSISELKEIAKYISKEEFLKKVINYNNACPKIINLEDCGDHGICSTTPCYSCWENAIKDIKFKGEDNMEFNWDDFKHKYIAVHCDTRETLESFIDECKKNNINVASKINFNKDLCYEIIEEDILIGGDIYYFKGRGYEIIEWKIENKIDYDREYDIYEVMGFSEETIFNKIGTKFKYKIMYGDLYCFDTNTNEYEKSAMSLERILNAKFKLVKKDKKIDFIEAIQAYGKEVYCIWNDGDGTEHKSEYCIRNEWAQCITDQNCEYLTPAEIVKGEWYIKED